MKAQIRFLLLTLCFTLLSQVALAKVEYTHHKLSNGLNLYIVPNHKVPAISHMIWYKAGSMDESDGKTGAAHFLEHLMFKGTKTVGNGEFSQLVESNGGSDNAFTSKDYTGYYQIVPKHLLEDVIKMEADRMQNLVIPKQEFEAEKQVVLEERNTRTDNIPAAKLGEKIAQALYGNFPYRNPIIGYRKDIEQLTEADILAFYKKFYRPDNASVVISGDVETAKAIALAEKYYGKLNNPEQELQRDIPKFTIDIAFSTVTHSDKNIGQEYISKYYLAPSYNETTSIENPDIYSIKIGCELLGGGSTGYLYKELVAKDKLASAAGCSYSMYKRGVSILVFYAVPANGVSLAKLEQSLDKKIQEFVTNGIEQEKINTTVKRYIKSTVFSQEGIQKLGSKIGRLIGHNIPVEEINLWQDKIKQITPISVSRNLKQIISADRSVTGYLKNEQ